MYPRICSMCNFTFYSEPAFLWHYIQSKNEDTRCMSAVEMKAFGFYQRDGGYETWGDRHRDSWDPDRNLWSSLYKPALMFDYMFPAYTFPKIPKWKRLLGM